MRTLFKLVKSGWIALGVVDIIILCIFTGYGLSAWLGQPEDAEVRGTITLTTIDEQGKEHQSTAEIFDGDMTRLHADLRDMLQQGQFRINLDTSAGEDYQLLRGEISFSAPTDRIIKAAAAAAMRVVVEEVLAEQLFGEQARSTVGELIALAPPEVEEWFGPDFERILTDLAGGDLDKGLGETIADLGESLEKMPEETVERIVDAIPGEIGDKTLNELLGAAPEEIKTFLGEDYEQVITEFFQGQTTKTVSEVIKENPGNLADLVEETIAGVLEGALAGELNFSDIEELFQVKEE